MTDDEFVDEEWVHIGQRWHGRAKKLYNAWLPLHDLNGEDIWYEAKRGSSYIVGGIYAIEVKRVDDRTTARFGDFKCKINDGDFKVEWAAEDRAARTEQRRSAAEKSAKKESQDISQMTLEQAKEFIWQAPATRQSRMAVILKELGL